MRISPADLWTKLVPITSFGLGFIMARVVDGNWRMAILDLAIMSFIVMFNLIVILWHSPRSPAARDQSQGGEG